MIRSMAVALCVVTALAGCTPGSTPNLGGKPANAPESAPGADLAGAKWAWIATQTPVEVITPPDPDRFTLEFGIDGNVAVLADCNRGSGPYAVTQSRRLTLGPLALTRMMCPEGSMDTEFLKELDNVSNYFFRGDTLYIDQKTDSGTMRFARR